MGLVDSGAAGGREAIQTRLLAAGKLGVDDLSERADKKKRQTDRKESMQIYTNTVW